MAPREIRLFAYGTLMQNEVNHVELGSARYIAKAQTVKGFQLWDLGPYPAMRAATEGCVKGELFWCTASRIRYLDHFEGHPSLFRRTPIDLADGSQAQAYIYQPEAFALQLKTAATGGGRRPLQIRSGNWSNRHSLSKTPSTNRSDQQ